jgi:hypothetical protein
MAVPVTEFKSLDPVNARLHSIADRTGIGACESGLAVLFSRLVQRLVSRCRESIAGAIEPLVYVVVARWCGMRSNSRLVVLTFRWRRP